MARRAVVMGVGFFMFVLFALPLFGYLTMQLWNWLLPHLFNVPVITFWQALGLIVLCRLLFGRVGGWGRGMRGRLRDKWGKLTPEQRERFVQGVRSKWENLSPEERERFTQWQGRCAPSRPAEPASPDPGV